MPPAIHSDSHRRAGPMHLDGATVASIRSRPQAFALTVSIEDRKIEIARGQAAFVCGFRAAKDVSVERTDRNVTVRASSALQIVEPSPVVVEDDLDTFVRRVAATRHPITFAALVGARHVANIRSERASELAWRLWCVALGPKQLPGVPKSLIDIVDTMYGREGGTERLHGKIVLGAAIESSPKKLVLAAVGVSVGIANLGGGGDEEFMARIDAKIGRYPSEEKQWLSMVTTALGLLDEHSPDAVRLLANALGFSVERPLPAAKPPRPAYPPPSDPPAVYETPFANTTLRLIETAGGSQKRFRVEVGGERRRVAVRKAVMDISNPKPESDDWLEDEDAELWPLVRCLESKATARTEKKDRLELSLRIDGPGDGESETWTAQVSVDDAGFVVIDMMHGYWACDPNVGW